MSDLDKISSVFNAKIDAVKTKENYKILKQNSSVKTVKLLNSSKLWDL